MQTPAQLIEIFEKLARALAQGEASFPTSTQVALRVVRMLEDSDCAIDPLARLVQAEPLLAARVVAMANSVVFNRSGREISDVKTALSRLGFSTVRTLATALLTRQMAGAIDDPVRKELRERLWLHTTHVAALAHTLARRVTGQNPDTALFAGVVHEIPGFYLLSCSAELPSVLAGGSAAWIESGEPLIGAALFGGLEVPAPVREAVECVWQGYLAMPPRTLGDTLLLADELAPVRSPLRETPEEMRAQGTTSMEMLVGEETLSEILADAASEVASLVEALSF